MNQLFLTLPTVSNKTFFATPRFCEQTSVIPTITALFLTMYCVVGRDGDCAAADSGRGGASAAARSGDVSRGGAAGGTETAQR